MNIDLRALRRSLAGAACLLAVGAAPVRAHGGHDAALGGSPALHVAAHLFGSPLTWALAAVAVFLLRRAWRAGDESGAAALGRADDQV